MMTRRQHQVRREILIKLHSRMSEDPFFRLYELGLEAGRLLSAGDRGEELQKNYNEARVLITRCRARANIAEAHLRFVIQNA